MSFILEALKKSEKKRQDGGAPSLETVHHAAPLSRRKTVHFGWLLLAVLVLNAGVLLWLFPPWQQKEVGGPVETLAAPLPLPVETSKRRADEASPLSITPASEVVTPAATPQAAVEPAAGGPQPVVQVQPAAAIESQPPVIHEKKSAANLDRQELSEKIYALAELPYQLSKEIPDMHMSVHAFYRDEPAANLVRINGQILRAGATLEGKFLLEEITSAGALFRYAGYRFLVPRKSLHN